MKILMITPYVTMPSVPEFSRNITGFGYMVYDIAHAIGNVENVDVLCTDTRGVGFVDSNVTFLRRSILLFLVNLHKCLSPKYIYQLWKNFRMQWMTLARMVYYLLFTGYLEKLLEKGGYDIVHIHGCGFGTDLWMLVCKRCGQKFVVTLHGLNSFSNTVKLEQAGKQYERDFLKRVVEGEFTITVISTGMKKLIEKTYGVKECRNIIVVCNSFSFAENVCVGKSLDDSLGLGTNSKIVLCVGNIGRRKNQGQLIRALELLPIELAKKTYMVFLGGNQEEDYTIEKISEGNKWASHIISKGTVPKEQVGGYYKQCDAVALMSLSEGFGLSLIEGMHFGKPSMSFVDIDAFEDIYHPDAMIGVKGHSDKSVAKGLELLLTKKWNAKRIKEYSEKFESQTMAKKYINVYQREI